MTEEQRNMLPNSLSVMERLLDTITSVLWLDGRYDEAEVLIDARKQIEWVRKQLGEKTHER